MSLALALQFVVLVGALFMGARMGGVGLGLWGAVGLLVLVAGFGLPPGALPGEVLIIVLTVIMAASAMEVAGGVGYLVRLAEGIIRRNPRHVTIVAMFPAVNGYFFLPNYGTLIAAMQFDRSGTTRIGRYLLNHSFMLPGMITTVGAVGLGFLFARLLPSPP